MRYALATWEVRDLLLIPPRQSGFWFQVKGERTRLACPSTRPRVEWFSPMFATRRREPHARARVLPHPFRRERGPRIMTFSGHVWSTLSQCHFSRTFALSLSPVFSVRQARRLTSWFVVSLPFAGVWTATRVLSPQATPQVKMVFAAPPLPRAAGQQTTEAGPMNFPTSQ